MDMRVKIAGVESLQKEWQMCRGREIRHRELRRSTAE